MGVPAFAVSCCAAGVGSFAGVWVRVAFVVWGYAFTDFKSQFSPILEDSWTANAAGCFVLGWILAIAPNTLKRFPNLFVAASTGFCGSFTTFSAWSQQANRELVGGYVQHCVLQLLIGVCMYGAFFFFGNHSAKGMFHIADVCFKRNREVNNGDTSPIPLRELSVRVVPSTVESGTVADVPPNAISNGDESGISDPGSVNRYENISRSAVAAQNIDISLTNDFPPQVDVVTASPTATLSCLEIRPLRARRALNILIDHFDIVWVLLFVFQLSISVGMTIVHSRDDDPPLPPFSGATSVVDVGGVRWDHSRLRRLSWESCLVGPFGAILRYYLALRNPKLDGSTSVALSHFWRSWPVYTFLVNWTGSLLFSGLEIAKYKTGTLLNPSSVFVPEDSTIWIVAMQIGFCGSLTTVSTAVKETIQYRNVYFSYLYVCISIFATQLGLLVMNGLFKWT